MVALPVVSRQADILIHIKSDDMFKREFPLFDKADQDLVSGNRRGACGETKDEFTVGGGLEVVYSFRNIVTDVFTDSGRVIADDETHN